MSWMLILVPIVLVIALHHTGNRPPDLYDVVRGITKED